MSQQHDVSELFDLGFIHPGPNRAICCKCRDTVELGEPEQSVAWLHAVVHRILCDELDDQGLI